MVARSAQFTHDWVHRDVTQMLRQQPNVCKGPMTEVQAAHLGRRLSWRTILLTWPGGVSSGRHRHMWQTGAGLKQWV